MKLLPAEWAQQEAILLTFPHSESDWGPVLETIEPVFGKIIKSIVPYEKVWINCQSIAHEKQLRQTLSLSGIEPNQIRFFHMMTQDTWARDHGPIGILIDGQRCFLNFVFNGWGGKYPCNLDNLINANLQEQGAFQSDVLIPIPFVLEGGSIESDGQGTLMTTTSCLLNPNRNPGCTQKEIEAELQKHLGVRRILWLHSGHLEGDDTDSHIDTLARFVNPHTIAYVQCDDPRDSHFDSLQAMEKELAAFRTADGKPYDLVPLPLPTIRDETGRRLAATYANFLIINQAVIAPVYGIPSDPATLAQDQIALRQLQRCFPDRQIVPILSRDIIAQNGSIHCLTMQIPAKGNFS